MANHLQSAALKGKIVEMTPTKHKRLVSEGVRIMKAINVDAVYIKKLFTAITHTLMLSKINGTK